MTQAYTGMRKGISLVEMIIAIVLFAALATISLKYTKNFLNTDMTAKKARVAAVTEQASQLLTSYQIYRTETGGNPTTIGDLNGSAGILTSIPTIVTEVSTLGWQYAADYNGTGLPAFYMKIDLNGTMNTASQIKSGKEYCSIFNREFNNSISLAVTDATTIGTQGNAATNKTTFGDKFCADDADVNNTTIVIFVP